MGIPQRHASNIVAYVRVLLVGVGVGQGACLLCSIIACRSLPPAAAPANWTRHAQELCASLHTSLLGDQAFRTEVTRSMQTWIKVSRVCPEAKGDNAHLV